MKSLDRNAESTGLTLTLKQCNTLLISQSRAIHLFSDITTGWRRMLGITGDISRQHRWDIWNKLMFHVS
jgi:hypothetical protein